jgi:hypothetical protein
MCEAQSLEDLGAVGSPSLTSSQASPRPLYSSGFDTSLTPEQSACGIASFICCALPFVKSFFLILRNIFSTIRFSLSSSDLSRPNAHKIKCLSRRSFSPFLREPNRWDAALRSGTFLSYVDSGYWEASWRKARGFEENKGSAVCCCIY